MSMIVCFFFFKQKTAYEMRISDWSSDVCSSDLVIPALIQSSKRGEFFVLDRRTGRPIVETVEKTVPQGGVAGETLSPTQPYPVGMATLTPKDLTAKDAWGATPIDQLVCRNQFAKYPHGGQYTPPTPCYGHPGYPAFTGHTERHDA